MDDYLLYLIVFMYIVVMLLRLGSYEELYSVKRGLLFQLLIIAICNVPIISVLTSALREMERDPTLSMWLGTAIIGLAISAVPLACGEFFVLTSPKKETANTI